MDGTLIDSQHDITVSINHVRAVHYGLQPLSSHFVVEAINRDQRNLAKLFYETDIYENAAKQLFEAHYHEQCVQNPRLYDGIETLLRSLKSEGFVMSVATNAPSPFARRMLEHLGVHAYFDRIVGADLVENPKPHPDMLQLIFSHYGFDPARHRGWMVGDNSKDMAAARNAGISNVFAAWGFASEGEGDHVCEHPMELLAVLS